MKHLFMLVLVVCLSLSAGEVYARIWTSTSNTRIDATLVEKGADYVVLQKKDGSRLKVPQSALSAQDRVYLRTAEVGESGAQASERIGETAQPVSQPKLIEGELRTWTARDGTTLNARLAKHSAQTVVLQDESGKFLQIPVSNFSDEDRRFLIAMQYKELEVQPPPPENYDYTIGKVHGPIRCKKDEKYSYYIYLPRKYNLSRKWPVLFFMSPSGGNENNFSRYTEGAELNDWIVVHSVESKNGFEGSGDAVKSMVDDVLDRFPADENRLYSSGFSGGARTAFWIASEYKKPFAGVLPCGAGGLKANLSSKSHIYGLEGSNCFNRWDMACTFKRYTKDKSFLWFFPGKHVWADKVLISDGICWLNGKYLELKGGRDEQLEAESYRYIKMMIERISSLVEMDPERAYRLVSEIDTMKAHKAFNKDVDQLRKKLEAMPQIQTYQKAEPEMRRLVKKYFETDIMDFQNNNCPDGLVKDAAALAEKYKDLRLAETIKAMGGPAPVM